MPRSAGQNSGRQPVPGLRIQMTRDFLAVRRAALQLREFLAARHFPENELWACELALVEACNNAVRHASAQPSEPIQIEVNLHAGELEIRINDRSSAFELPSNVELPPDEAEGGRGLFLIQSLMDQVRCERLDSMNCLVLRKTITGI